MSESMEKTMRMRTYVLKEILKTEKDYVETLKFLVDVFMERLRGREEDENDRLVPAGTVELLLANIEDLYEFHQNMLKSVEEALSPEPSYLQELGKTFLKHETDFQKYKPYCTNHERAQKRLNELTENQEFQGFILGCLLLGNYVNDVSMEGFLLTPIQRICKYPLLLRELLKKTPPEHSDYDDVKAACELMKDVCSNVNETKRQLEQLEKLEEIQASIANWEGVNLTDVCTRLIKQGPLLKISVGNFQERQFFLFDHLLVYAKKVNNLPRLQSTVDSKTATIRRAGRASKQKSTRDLQKKWIFKGRISTELMEIENLEDGASDFHCGGSSVANAWKVLNAAKNKWFVLIAKDKEEKEAWLNEFILEREKRKSKVNLEQRDSIDVIHAKGKKLYFRLTHQNIIRDRKHKMRTYPKSFHGNELVTWLVENKESPSNDEAVRFGQALLDCGLIHHVNDKHHFRNESILYRFRYDDGTFKTRGENQDIVAKGLRVYCRLHCLFQPVIRVKDKNWKSHKFVVEGRKLIDWLVEQGDCQNRDEASNFGQTLCENAVLHHASDKQDFKNDNSLFRYYPDEETLDRINSGSKKSSSKSEFRLQQSYQTKTLLLLNVSETPSLGMELKVLEDKLDVVVSSVEKDSQAQRQGFKVGMMVVQINNTIVTSCNSEETLRRVMKFNLDRYKLIHFVVEVANEDFVKIPITDKGLGFQIKGSRPCVVHNLSEGGVAMNNGLLKGHAILEINGKPVKKITHDEVAAAIREGCKPRPKTEHEDSEEKKKNDEARFHDDDSKTGGGSAVSTPSAMRRGLSLRKTKNKAAKDKKSSNHVTTPTENVFQIELKVGNRHLERTCIYTFTNVNGAKTSVVEKMSETPSIFDLAAQLMDVLAAEDTQVLADVQRLDKIASQIAEKKAQVFERRKSLRFEVIQDRLENYKKYKRHLTSYMWPSYKMAENSNNITAKDFCPTNCHVNLLTVTHPTERSHLKGFGLTESKGDNEMFDCENLVNTTNCVTCVAAPSFRTKGPGLYAVLRGAEGNTDLMDNVRHLMVALDHALLELKQGQQLLSNILHSEAAERDKRNSFQSMRNSYPDNNDLLSPVLLSPCSNPIPEEEQINRTTNPGKDLPTVQVLPINQIEAFDSEANQEQKTSPKEITPNGISLNERQKLTLDLHVSSSNSSDSPQSAAKETESAAGHESECDSGIHSNRGSMADNEKLPFSFATPNPSENNNDNRDADDKTNRTSGISTTNSSDRLSVSDDHKTIKGSNSLPTLSTPPPSGNNSSSSTRSPKKRPISGRQRLSCLSTAGSTCSSDGVESLSFPDLDLSPDGIDKLHGTMEHFISKIENLGKLVKSDVVQSVFQDTKETTPNRDYDKIIDAFNVSSSPDTIKMSLAVCNDVKQVSDVIKTVIESIEEHAMEVRIQLVLALLLHEDPQLVARRDKIFCQALITAISSFSIQLRCALAGTFNNMKAYGVPSEDASWKWLNQCMSIGACVVFQTMLDLDETDESAMLDDSSVGIYDLERVSFHFKAITAPVEANECPFNVNNKFDGPSPVSIDGNGVGYSIEGNRCALKVFFHLEKHVFIKLPPRLQAGGGVKLVPILINHGLNDLGDHIYEHEVTKQAFTNRLNEKGYEKMYDYYKRFRAFHFDRSKLPRDTEARAVLVDKLSRPLNALDEVVTLLENNVKPRHGRPNLTTSGCGILPLSWEYCQRVGACSVAACPNGVYRSSASCALQQAFALSTCHGLPPKHMLLAAYQMCKIGARSFAEAKNLKLTPSRCQASTPRLFKLFLQPPESKPASRPSKSFSVSNVPAN